MHVLMIPSWYPLDAEDINGIFFKDYAYMLTAEGIQVGIVSPQLIGFRDKKRVLNASLYSLNGFKIDNGIPTFFSAIMNIPKRFKPLYYLTMGNKLGKSYISEYGVPDIIVAQGSIWAASIAKNLSNLYGVPYIVIEHNSRFLGNGIISNLEKSYAKKGVSHANALICVSSALGNGVKKILNLDIEYQVIPNPLSSDRVMSQNIDQRRDILTVGMLNKNKGTSKIITAYAQSAVVDAHDLHVVGDGPEMSSLKNLCSHLGISDKVFFHGKKDREYIFSLMRSSFMYVSGSKHETFGLALIEALSHGLPVATTPSGGPNDIINPSNGIVSKSDSTQDLTEAINSIYQQIDVFDRALISKTTVNKYSTGSISKQYVELFNRLATMESM